MKRFRPRTRRQKLVRDLFLLVLLLLLAYILLDFPMFTPKQAAEVTQTRYLFGPAELLELVRPEPDGNQFYYVGQTDEYHCVITLTRRGLFWRHKTVRGLRVGDSEARFLDLYGSLDARDEMMIDLLHVTIENGVVTEISMGRYE